jgi:hypothetical protein
MLKAASDGNVGSNPQDRRVMTDEQRRRLVWASFPPVRIYTSKGHSQAPNEVLTLTYIQDGDF